MEKIKFLLFILLILLVWYLGRPFHIDSQAIENGLKKFPIIYSGIIFILLYVVATFFIWLSKDIFRLVAALLFGAYLSTLFIWIAETINALVLFYLARSLGREFVEKSLKTGRALLDEKLARINFFWLFMLRAVPILPFRFLDLSVGLTKISFRRYILAVVLGSPLRIFWLQYVLAAMGKSVFNPQLLSAYIIQDKTFFLLNLAYLLLVILVALRMQSKKGF